MRSRYVFVVVLAACVALAGCGGDGTASRATGASAAAGAPAASATGGRTLAVPDVSMTDVATGTKVSLRSRVATDRPTLFWAWAPY